MLVRLVAVSVFVLRAGATLAADGAPTPDDLQTLEATRNRPLFAPSRRPPPITVVDAAPTAPASTIAPTVAPPPDIRVSGIIVGGDRRMALVKHTQDQPAVAVSIGSRIDGWTVSSIDVRTIVLQLDARTVTVPLSRPGR